MDGVDGEYHMAKIIDLSTKGNRKTVDLIVRPYNHFMGAYPGDKIRIDASEMAPAVKKATWTEEEADAAAREIERRRAGMFTETANPQQKAADLQFAAVVAKREAEAEAERKKAPANGDVAAK
jgi:leucyl-tRNA synthetase